MTTFEQLRFEAQQYTAVVLLDVEKLGSEELVQQLNHMYNQWLKAELSAVL